MAWKRVVKARPDAFEGIGVAIGKSGRGDAVLDVLDMLRGGPADRAGLRTGDQIARIGDVEAATLDADGARDALRGPAGSRVRLAVKRDGQLQSMVVERATIQPRS